MFGQLTPFPATPLYDRLVREKRLTRPKHWLEFAPFQMAHTPLDMSIPEVQSEVRQAWLGSYSPERTREALLQLDSEPAAYKVSHLIARLFFRGIYFPHKNVRGWLNLIWQNRASIVHLVQETRRKGLKVASRGATLELGSELVEEAGPAVTGD